MDNQPNSAKDKILFTPGPLRTSPTVKQAMLRDISSRDYELINLVRDIRNRLVLLGAGTLAEYTAILLQGSGTYAVEAVFSSTVSSTGKVLIVVNGSYCQRMVNMVKVLKIDHLVLEYAENCKPALADLEAALAADPAITHVCVVHCETTTGLLNPIQAVGELVQRHGRIYFVDAMSSFGAVPVDLAACHIDYLVSSANKCIEGVPGFAFVLARTATLLRTEGYARSLVLDLLGQYKGLEGNGQFRFTPPTHTLLAFRQALLELEAEGGVAGRATRYNDCRAVLMAGMNELGFQAYLAPTDQSHIVSTFRYPAHPNFHFDEFYRRLNEKGFVIYAGKVSNADCFRIGTIGRLCPADVHGLLAAIRLTLSEMGLLDGSQQLFP